MSSQRTYVVIPAKAGIQNIHQLLMFCYLLDLRDQVRDDGFGIWDESALSYVI